MNFKVFLKVSTFFFYLKASVLILDTEFNKFLVDLIYPAALALIGGVGSGRETHGHPHFL